MFGNFADVQQAVSAREQLDERAKLSEAHDFAEIGLANFGAGRDFTNHRQSGVARSSAGGEDMHRPVFEDVNLDASRFRNGLDLLSAGTNQVADLVGGDAELVETRRVCGDL